MTTWRPSCSAGAEEAWKGALSTGARLLEDREDAAAALVLYAKAKDAPSILRIVESDGFALLERGQADALSTALEALPDESRWASPAALGLRATLEAARGHFDPAYRQFVAAIERAQGDKLRLTLVYRYAIELVRQGRDSSSCSKREATDDRIPAALRVPLLGTLATAYTHAARSGEALATIATALELLDPAAGDVVRARLYQQAAHVYCEEENHDLARRYAQFSVELALQRSLHDVAVRAYSVLYQIAYDDEDEPDRVPGDSGQIGSSAREKVPAARDVFTG